MCAILKSYRSYWWDRRKTSLALKSSEFTRHLLESVMEFWKCFLKVGRHRVLANYAHWRTLYFVIANGRKYVSLTFVVVLQAVMRFKDKLGVLFLFRANTKLTLVNFHCCLKAAHRDWICSINQSVSGFSMGKKSMPNKEKRVNKETKRYFNLSWFLPPLIRMMNPIVQRRPQKTNYWVLKKTEVRGPAL